MIPLGSYDLSDLKILESLIVKDQQNHTLLQYVCFVVLLYFDTILFYLFIVTFNLFDKQQHNIKATSRKSLVNSVFDTVGRIYRVLVVGHTKI